MLSLKWLWDLITGSAKNKPKQADVNKKSHHVVSDKKKIVSILMRVADEGAKVELTFNSRILIQKTLIMLEENKKGELSSNYLKSGDHILLKKLDTMYGRDKLWENSGVSIQFVRGNILYEFKTTVVEGSYDVTAPFSKMKFPKKVLSKVRRRDTERFKVSEKSKVFVSIQRPSLISFPVALLDISMGGMSFFQDTIVADLIDSTKLKITLEWPEKQEVRVDGIVVKTQEMAGKLRVHIKFINKTINIKNKLIDLIAYVEYNEVRGRTIDILN